MGPQPGQPGYDPNAVGPDGEKGLGSTLLGGGAGAFLGHKAGGGALGTVIGTVVGAIGANIVSDKTKKHKKKKSGEHLAYGESSYGGSSAGLYPGYGKHKKEKKHHRSRSRGGGSSSSSSDSD
jgi:hypothetical protein